MGLIVSENNPKNNETLLISKLLTSRKINLMLDVGANAGQTALKFIKLGFSGRILSFEPVPVAFKELKKRSDRYHNWTAFESAVGEKNGEIEIHVAGNIESSSVLPMLDTHKKAAPGSQGTEIQKAKIQTLNSLHPTLIKAEDKIFLKIDVQGFEPQVLLGADHILPFVDVLQIELSLIRLYEGAPLYEEVIKILEGKGFKLFSLFPGFSDPKSGQLYQMDGLFVRP